jgi:GNAT superfamily N-acetyltransferase
VSRPPVEVRKACADDLDDLLLLWSQSREELSRNLRSLGAVPVDQLRSRLRETLVSGEPPVLIARYEGEPAGYAVLRIAPVLAVDPAALHIDHLYVAPALRRRGVARALLVVVTGIAERNGADQVLAGAPPNARDTHRFLARLGFSPLVVRRVTGTAALRRRLAGTGERRGLEDLLSRRRSLRARATRAGWPGTGWVGGTRPVDVDDAPVVDPVPAERTAPIVIAECAVRQLDLGPLDAESLARRPLTVDEAVRPDLPGPGDFDPDEPTVEHGHGHGRRRQRA